MFKFVEAEKKITSLDIRFANVATIYHDPDSWPKAGVSFDGSARIW